MCHRGKERKVNQLFQVTICYQGDVMLAKRSANTTYFKTPTECISSIYSHEGSGGCFVLSDCS